MNLLKISESLNKAYRRNPISKNDMLMFQKALRIFFLSVRGQGQEKNKETYLRDFLRETFYGQNDINKPNNSDIDYDDRVEIENTGHLPDELTVETIKQSHHSYPQNPTIADVLFKTTFLENWGSGVGRMVDACKKANLPEPEFNHNAAFVWVTFKRALTQPYNPTTPQPHKFPPQPHNLKR